ncbi:MAG: Lrp/AsnC family transcriptional regulator [Thermodesulfobacteriota bacterium]|nr:Lrp/AsnC family transcriptional regulator [Thermodesulfobacteriota bacterium]
MITEEEIKIAHCIQADISLEQRPFASIGVRTGISESEVINTINGLRERGVIRRFGAVLRHREAGYRENAMVLWAVPEEHLEKTGRILASYREISHCYGRTPPFEGRYTLFSMIHSAKGGVEEFVRKISESIDISDYLILKSEEEYKKTSMEYF